HAIHRNVGDASELWSCRRMLLTSPGPGTGGETPISSEGGARAVWLLELGGLPSAATRRHRLRECIRDRSRSPRNVLRQQRYGKGSPPRQTERSDASPPPFLLVADGGLQSNRLWPGGEDKKLFQSREGDNS